MSYSKNYICKFIQSNSWDHKLFHFHLSFGILKLWKGREKIAKTWISRMKKAFLMKWKTFLIIFEGLSLGEKIKIWKKYCSQALRFLLHVGRGVLISPFMKTPPFLPYIAYPLPPSSPFSNFMHPYLHCSFCCPVFLLGIHSMQGWTATMRHGITRKKSTKKITTYRESV